MSQFLSLRAAEHHQRGRMIGIRIHDPQIRRAVFLVTMHFDYAAGRR